MVNETIDDLVAHLDRFEQAWKEGRPADFDSFLSVDESIRSRLVHELVQLDLEHRWRGDSTGSGVGSTTLLPDRPLVEDYAAQFETRVANGWITPDLIAHEYRVRRRWGDRPERSQYLERFPEHRESLDALLDAVDRELEQETRFAGDPASLRDSVGSERQTTVALGGLLEAHIADAEELPDVPFQFQCYQLEERIGRGGYGEVWRGMHLLLNQRVAVKFLRSDRSRSQRAAERFIEEGRKLAMLNHPGIVRVLDAGVEDERCFIVSQLVEGGTLADRLADPIPPRDAACIVADVADALHHAHRQGIVHRDVKPSNVLMDPEGKPRLTDFGLAITEEEQLEEPAGVVGTYPYMSPEQIRGDSRFSDARTDIYSLGVVLYELLTGRRPFVAKTGEQWREQILRREPRPLRTIDDSIPPELEQICLKCLSKDVTQRYTTAADLAQALKDHVAPGPPASRPAFRRRAGVVLCVCLALVAGALWNSRETDSSNRDAATPVAPPEVDPAPPAAADLVTVVLPTDPPGAVLTMFPLSNRTGLPRTDEKFVFDTSQTGDIRVPPGHYLVVAVVEGHGFHEVFRDVPAPNDAMPVGPFSHQMWIRPPDEEFVQLETIVIPGAGVTADMVLFEPDVPFPVFDPFDRSDDAEKVSLPSFFLDPHEVTVAEYLAELPEGFFPHFWPEAWEQQPPPGNHSLRMITYNEAVAFAEKIGKRLPDSIEWLYAATNGGTTLFPWGDGDDDLAEWTFGPIGEPGFDRLRSHPSVVGLYSNVAEWTTSWTVFGPGSADPEGAGMSRAASPHYRMVCGGSPSIVDGTPDGDDWRDGAFFRIPAEIVPPPPGVGFRCVRSAQPRTSPEHFIRIAAQPE